MFVPAPPLKANGTVTRHSIVSASSKTDALSLEACLADLQVSTSSYQSIRGRRTRAQLSKGVTSTGFTDTPYFSLAVDFKPSGESLVVTARGTGAYRRFDGRRISGLGAGYSGGYSTGVNQPWAQFDWESTSSKPTHILNRLTVLNLAARVENEAKLKARQEQMDLSETLVLRDIRESVLLVARRTSQVLRVYNLLRSGRIREAYRFLGFRPRHLPKTASQAWLELQYGWRPMLSDIHMAMNVTNNLLSRESYTYTVTRRGKTGLTVGSYLQTGPDLKRIDTGGDVLGEVETKLRFCIADPWKHYLTSLSVENPLYYAWVSIPMSFLIDWIAPVSDWLKGMTAPFGLDFTGGYTTVKTSGHFYEVAELLRQPYTPVLSRGQVRYDCSLVRIRRTKLTSWPYTRPYITFPFSSNARIASAIALAVSLNQ